MRDGIETERCKEAVDNDAELFLTNLYECASGKPCEAKVPYGGIMICSKHKRPQYGMPRGVAEL